MTERWRGAVIYHVYSHTSDRHPWFRASRERRSGPKSDWYVWADAKRDGTPPNNWQSLFHGPAWTWDTRRGQYHLHNFLRDNPPRGGGPHTRPVDFQTLLNNADRPETLVFLERLRAVLDTYPDRFALGEIGGPDAAERSLAAYLAPGRLHTAYSFIFLRAADPTPAVSRWSGRETDAAFAQLLNAVLLCLRGSACLYQGEEPGLPQAHIPFECLQDPEALANWPSTFGRDGARTPLPWTAEPPHAGFSRVEPWLPVDARHLQLAVAAHDGGAWRVIAGHADAVAGAGAWLLPPYGWAIAELSKA